MNVLFLSLKGFAGVGGIEKVNRVVMRMLSDLKQAGPINRLLALAAYDDLPDERYIAKEDFKGFRTDRVAFSKKAVQAGRSADVVIFSHINLAPVGLLIRLFNPSAQLLLIAHGIEIWPRLSWLKRTFLKQCRVLAISQFTKEQIVRNNGIDPERITILHNAIDPLLRIPGEFTQPAYLQERYRIRPNDIVLLTITRMSAFEKNKGYDHVIKAVAGLKKQYPNLRYLMAGKCDPAEQQRLETLIASLGVQSEVTLTGYLPEEEFTDHLLLSDVFVMPSKKEGFGIVFVEALACGRVVIAGNRDGSRDAIDNGRLGLLADPDSADDIQRVLEQAIARAAEMYEEDRHRLSQEALKNFGFEHYKQNWISVLQQCEKSPA